jgi:hypothetical protein
MRVRTRTALLAAVVGCIGAIRLPVAAAQDEGGVEEGETGRRERAVHETMNTAEKNKARYGVALRLRWVYVPKWLMEAFAEEVSSGVSKPGIGIEFVRRKVDFSIHIGLEHESVSPRDGFWLEKGDNPAVPGQYPDFVEFDGLSWTTIDAEFAFLKELGEGFELRYGAGFGLGLVHGDVLQTDSMCPADVMDIQQDCTAGGGAQVNDPADLPPVFPVVNVLFGAQYTPIPNVAISLQLGLRTVFYAGLGTTYFF